MLLNATRKLAIDESFMHKAWGVISHVEPLEKYKENPIVVADKPWEDRVQLYGSVLKMDGIYKMWYHARAEQGAIHTMNYAESTDGIHWVKPELDVATYKGQKTNVVFGTLAGHPFTGSNYSVLYTPWDTGKEYKMIYTSVCNGEHNIIAARMQADLLKQQMDMYEALGDPNMVRKSSLRYNAKMNIVRQAEEKAEDAPRTSAVYTAWSSDGIHWECSDAPSCYDVDDVAHMFYDEKTNEYLVYGRTVAMDPMRAAKDKMGKHLDHCASRAVVLCRSKDCFHFSPAKHIYTSDAYDNPYDEIHAMAVFPWEDRYLALVQMFHGAADALTLDVQLAISNDGERFTRIGDRNPFIPLGGIGEWDRFNTAIASAPVIEGDKVRFYFDSGLQRHTPAELFTEDLGNLLFSIGFGEVETDRFACLMASFDGGEMETIPFTIEGSKLILNCTSRFGEIKVAFKGAKSGKCEEFTVSENGLAVAVPIPAWAKQEETSLHFTLKNAKLYSYCSQD